METAGQTNRQIEGQTDRETEGQTDRKTNRHGNRRTDRQVSSSICFHKQVCVNWTLLSETPAEEKPPDGHRANQLLQGDDIITIGLDTVE